MPLIPHPMRATKAGRNSQRIYVFSEVAEIRNVSVKCNVGALAAAAADVAVKDGKAGRVADRIDNKPPAQQIMMESGIVPDYIPSYMEGSAYPFRYAGLLPEGRQIQTNAISLRSCKREAAVFNGRNFQLLEDTQTSQP